VLAQQLLAAAEELPRYDNLEFYSASLQTEVLKSVREANPSGFDELISLISERVAQWPYCVLISGLRFDDANRLFVGINRAFGKLVAPPFKKPRAQLVHYVQPQTDRPSSRGGCESERLHTDTADWAAPVELISMVCVKEDSNGGGRSRILDVDSVRKEVSESLGTEALELLETESVPWQLATYFGGGVKWRPVLTKSSICWRRYTIDLALQCEGATLSNEMLSSLDALEDVISSSTRTVDFLMREGELLFSDNTRTIHARTPLADAKTSNRLMIRSWIRTS